MITSDILDFIPSLEVEEVYFKTFFSVSTEFNDFQQRTYYERNEDEKWKQFCKDHNLRLSERKSDRWFNIYLTLCAEGII